MPCGGRGPCPGADCPGWNEKGQARETSTLHHHPEGHAAPPARCHAAKTLNCWRAAEVRSVIVQRRSSVGHRGGVQLTIPRARLMGRLAAEGASSGRPRGEGDELVTVRRLPRSVRALLPRYKTSKGPGNHLATYVTLNIAGGRDLRRIAMSPRWIS